MPRDAAADARRPGLRTWLARIGWLVAIWVASVAALAAAAWVMRGLMHAAGMR